METDRILMTIEARLAQLTAARNLLASDFEQQPGHKRMLSAEARKRMSAAQKKRRAKENAA
jgi:hypothetical protein